jgi:hypothetical protein
MDTTLLNVPYTSQKAPGANLHNNDCGAASMSMMLKAFGLAKDLTVDELYDAVNPTNADVGLAAGSIISKMSAIGLKASWKVFSSPAELFTTLQAGKPVIALIHYEPMVTHGFTQFTNFKNGHFVILAGMDIAKIFVQDPDRDDGKTVTDVPIDVFWEAWGQCALDGNPCFCGIVSDNPITDLSQPIPIPVGAGRYVLTVNGAYVHAEASEKSPTISPTIVWQRQKSNLAVVTITKVVNGYGHRLEGGWVCMELLKPKDD